MGTGSRKSGATVTTQHDSPDQQEEMATQSLHVKLILITRVKEYENGIRFCSVIRLFQK